MESVGLPAARVIYDGGDSVLLELSATKSPPFFMGWSSLRCDPARGMRLLPFRGRAEHLNPAIVCLSFELSYIVNYLIARARGRALLSSRRLSAF
jgi:hypothetical protein